MQRLLNEMLFSQESKFRRFRWLLLNRDNKGGDLGEVMQTLLLHLGLEFSMYYGTGKDHNGVQFKLIKEPMIQLAQVLSVSLPQKSKFYLSDCDPILADLATRISKNCLPQ
jgi:hypothetical protein